MLIFSLLLVNLLLLGAGLIGPRLREAHREFAFSLLQTVFFLPLLAAEYLGVAFRFLPPHEGYSLILTSQSIFLVIWGGLARRLQDALSTDAAEGRPEGMPGRFHVPALLLLLGNIVLQAFVPGFALSGDGVVFPSFGGVYFSSLLSVLIMVFMAWQLEAFWRQLPHPRRQDYRVLVTGCALVCGVQGWAASYRLTYMRLHDDVLTLQGTLLLLAWLLILFAVLRRRLLNRRLFISRKVVYATVAPTLFAAYLISLGLISLVMRLSGSPLHAVLQGFLVVAGLVVLALLLLSAEVRRRVKYFISTHFYVNKYEYRDEWLAFSGLLREARTEAAVLAALHAVLRQSLYTRRILLWAGGEQDGFRLMEPAGVADAPYLMDCDPIVVHLREHRGLHLEQGGEGSVPEAVRSRLAQFPAPAPVLFAAISAGGRMVGCIGLGPEDTGGRYDQDDFDLLAALGSQAASALLAVRFAEEAGRMRELKAVQSLSVFVLHDIKNAASLLSLVHANAQRYMDKPEFREDMLAAVGDALRRMTKVQHHLASLQGAVEPEWREISLGPFLEELVARFHRSLPSLDLVCSFSPPGLLLGTDPSILATVLENLILNAREAGGPEARIRIGVVAQRERVVLEVADSGPGVAEQLLPDRLFEPFVSGRDGGHGIGLWQARTLLTRLGGGITAQNDPEGGARFRIELPRRVGGGGREDFHGPPPPEGQRP